MDGRKARAAHALEAELLVQVAGGQHEIIDGVHLKVSALPFNFEYDSFLRLHETVLSAQHALTQGRLGPLPTLQ